MKLLLASEFTESFHKTKNIIRDHVNGQKVIFIPTAAIGENFEPTYERTIQPFEDCGAIVETLDIRNISESNLREFLKDISAIYVCGGNTFYLLEKMRACNFEKVLREKLNDGLLYIGSSAGSIVLSPDIDFIRPMDTPEKANLSDTIGLNLIDFSFVPHLEHSTMGEAASEIKKKHTSLDQDMFVLKDDEVIYVENKKTTFL